jgi:hypothetical protein
MGTQAVTFEFISPQFVFECGHVTFFKGARLWDGAGFSPGKVIDGRIEEVLVEGPIECDLLLTEQTVMRRSDRNHYDVACLYISRTLTEADLRSGRVTVTLDLPVLLIIRVENIHGERVPRALVSIAPPSTVATWEMTTNETGEVVFFGERGRYLVGVGRIGDRWLDDRVMVNFELGRDEGGERVITLRVP